MYLPTSAGRDGVSHFLAPENVVFAWALGLLVVLGTLQLVLFLFGLGLSSLFDHVLPDLHFDADAPSGLESILSLLGLGKVPLAVSLLLFLFLFSFVGYNLQLVLAATPLGALSALPAAGAAFVTTLPLLRLATDGVARVIPRDETLAVSEKTFVGRIARITLGTVTRERSSEARLEDDHGHAHYVQVIAEDDGDSFEAGDEVIIVRQEGSRFTVVRGPQTLLE